MVKIREKIAGFAFIKKIEKEGVVYTSVAEFFILKKYRKLGIGKRVARMIFDRFPGEWYVDVIQSNELASLFWERVINDYTSGKYNKSFDEGQKKNIFTFENK